LRKLILNGCDKYPGALYVISGVNDERFSLSISK